MKRVESSRKSSRKDIEHYYLLFSRQSVNVCQLLLTTPFARRIACILTAENPGTQCISHLFNLEELGRPDIVKTLAETLEQILDAKALEQDYMIMSCIASLRSIPV